MKLAARRCLIHADREAVARCPACRQYYCRECVVEHDFRLLCAACLRKSIEGDPTRKAARFNWLSPLWLLLGFLGAYLSFYTIERILLLIPANIYNGSWMS